MRLENLYPNFGTATPEKQAAYVADYRRRRARDMERTPTWPKVKKTKTRVPKAKPAPLSPEELALKDLLGLTKKQIIEMREM